jgi:hemerythrin-like metal-binding protein
MALIEWKDDYSVGIEGIDSQHKRLFEAVNILAEAIRVNENRSIVEQLLVDLTEIAKDHFRAEAELMEKHGFPNVEDHKRQHREFLELVTKFNGDYLREEEIEPYSLLEFLKDLVDHTMTSDMEYIAFLRKHD